MTMLEAKIRNMNILIIDDEDKITELIKVFLQSMGQFNSIVTARDTLQAMQKFQNQRFDLIILDHVLPGKLGIEFAENLHKSMKYNKIPILLISGYLQQEDVLKSVEIGVKNILVKPFTRQQLLSKVKEILSLNNPPQDDDVAS